MTNKPNGGGLRNRIISYGCLIYDFTEDKLDNLPNVTIRSMWDTGATNLHDYSTSGGCLKS